MSSRHKNIKIVAIGAGSHVFGRRAIADVLNTEELRNLDCTLTLVDINEETLERMHKLATMMKDYFDSPVEIEATCDRVEALQKANYVIIAVSRKRYELWEQDFRVPLSYGFKQSSGECGGPGAVFHTMRSLDLVIPICKDVEKICPEALVLNFTNPESRIIMAINYLTEAKAVGLCHNNPITKKLISRILNRPEKNLNMIAGGLNHFFWVYKIVDATIGEDLFPEVQRIIHENPTPIGPRPRMELASKMTDIFGMLISLTDDHIGEYLSFAHEFTGVKWMHGRESHTPSGYEGIQRSWHGKGKQWLDPYIEGEKPLDERATAPSDEAAIPIICDIEFNRKTWRPAVNVLNDGLYVENLPADAVVEVPAIIDAQGLHPVKVGPLPEALAAMCRTQISIQKLLVEAYRTKKKNLLLQALLLDPVVNSVSRAEKLLDDMLELQAEYLPIFK